MLPPDTTTFHAEYVRRHSRLTTFFRALLAIPHYVVLFFYGIVAGFAILFAWFAIVITGRYPKGLYDVVAGFFRYYGRVYAYYYLLSDPYPPFTGDPATPYPAELAIGPPKERYSRLLTFFRIILLIPVYIVAYVLAIVLGIAAIVAWVVIVITGRLPRGLHNALSFSLSYTLRAGVYAALLTERFPSFDGEPTEPASAAPVAATPGGFTD